MKVADGVSPSQAESALGTVLARWPNGALQDQAAFEASVGSQIDIVLNLILGLLGLAMVIALIGIANRSERMFGICGRCARRRTP